MRGLPVDSRKWWTERDAKKVVRAWRRSGVSQRAFAEKHGLSRQRLCYWNSRLKIEQREPAPQFVPGVVIESSATVSIRVATSTIEVNAPARVPPEWVADLVSRLSGSSCS